MSGEEFYPDDNKTETEEQPRVSLEKPSQTDAREDAGGSQGIYRTPKRQMQGEFPPFPGGAEYGYRQDGMYSQNASGQNYYQAQQFQQPGQGFGIASLTLGIISLALFCTCINIPLAVMAIIFGILQLVNPESKKGMAVFGIITSVISLILFVISIFAFFLSADFQEDLQDGLQRGLYEEYFNEYRLPYFNEDDEDAGIDDGYDPFDAYDEDFTF